MVVVVLQVRHTPHSTTTNERGHFYLVQLVGLRVLEPAQVHRHQHQRAGAVSRGGGRGGELQARAGRLG